MKDRLKPTKKRLKWLELFLPEDSNTELKCKAVTIGCEGGMGYLKFWVWIVISICMALALGQL